MKNNICNRSSSYLPSSHIKTVDSRQFDSKYRIGTPISEDANGTVYRGKSAEDNSDVAIRLFTRDSKPVVAPSKNAKISVAQIIEVDEVRMSKNGIPFTVMDLPRGICLESLLRKKGVLPLKTSLQIALNVSLVVRFLHMYDMVHGHVNPRNIFVNRTNQDTLDVQLLHHGLDGQPSKFNLPENLSPELSTECASLSEADDIWAVGVLLYRMVFGAAPFSGQTLQATYQQIQRSPLILPHPLDEEVRPVADLLKKILSKNPSERLDGRRLNLALKSLLASQRVEPDSVLPRAKSAIETTVWINASSPRSSKRPPTAEKIEPERPIQVGLNPVAQELPVSNRSAGTAKPRIGGYDNHAAVFCARDTKPSMAPFAVPRDTVAASRLRYSEAVTDLDSSNDCAQTRRSIDTRVIAKQEQRMAKRTSVFKRASLLLTKKKSKKDTDLGGTAVTVK